MDKIDLEIAKETSSAEFLKKIKNKCAWCGADIPGTLAWYCAWGNACDICTTRFSMVVDGVRDWVMGKNGRRKKGKKIREYTETEIEEMVINRIAEVNALKNKKPRYIKLIKTN